MNFQRSRDSYSMGTHKGIYGDEIDFKVAMCIYPILSRYSIQLRPDISSVMSADSCKVNLVSMLNNKLVDLVQ